MPTLHCLPDGRTVETAEGETILAAAMRSGIPHAHACGGRALCSTCRIWVLDGVENCTARNAAETVLADRLRFGPELRLACQTAATGGLRYRRLVLDELDLDITSQLARNRLGPCGESRSIVAMFADIRDFTGFSEALSPYDVMYVLNRCMFQLGEIVDRNGGHVDNVVGDSLLALFGVRDDPDAALKSVKAGLETLQAIDRLKPYMTAMYGRAFDIGIGLHYGEAVIGRMGTARSERLTAIGDTVNVASRIEAANKEAGTRLLASQELYALVEGSVEIRDYVRVKLRGTSERKTLYEVTGLTAEAQRRLAQEEGGGERTQRFAGLLWTRCLDADKLPPGGRKVLERPEFDLQLVRQGDTVFAFNNACPHLHLPFNESAVTDDGGLVCRWHESCFDLATGAIRSWCDALLPDGTAKEHPEIGNVSKNRRAMTVYPARISDGGIWVALDPP